MLIGRVMASKIACMGQALPATSLSELSCISELPHRMAVVMVASVCHLVIEHDLLACLNVALNAVLNSANTLTIDCGVLHLAVHSILLVEMLTMRPANLVIR